MNRALIGGGITAVLFAYLLGFWPGHRQLGAAQAEITRLQVQLAEAEDKLRLTEVFGQALRLADAIAARNDGEAAALSSAFFDRAQQELGRTSRLDTKQALERILQTRDQVTTEIARSESSVADALRNHVIALRRALGLPVE